MVGLLLLLSWPATACCKRCCCKDGDGEEDVYESIAYGNLQGNDAGIDTYGELNSTSMSIDETATPRQSQTLLVAHEDVL